LNIPRTRIQPSKQNTGFLKRASAQKGEKIMKSLISLAKEIAKGAAIVGVGVWFGSFLGKKFPIA